MATEVRKLVDAWFGKPDPNAEEPYLHYNLSASDRLDELIEHSPEEAWSFILEANSRPYSDKRRSMLAAGPLENLLGSHGESLISRIEHESKSDPRFKALLLGVWQGRMTDPIWARVQALRK